MKPFKQGMNAFYRGKFGNPYDDNTEEHRGWELGYNRAYFNNLERVKARERGETVPKKKGHQA